MKLEWDETKREATFMARSLDFANVALIDWNTAITLEDTRQPYPETRFITSLPSEVASAWYRNEKLRVISLRKANDREVKLYG